MKKILLCVDDEATGLRIRKLILEKSGYEVLTAEDGRHGLELFQSQPVDAVVLDYYMPGMDGGTVAAEMKRLKPQVPVLMLSAYISLPEHALDAVDDFFTKGQPTEQLLAKIAELVSSASKKGGAAG